MHLCKIYACMLCQISLLYIFLYLKRTSLVCIFCLLIFLFPPLFLNLSKQKQSYNFSTIEDFLLEMVFPFQFFSSSAISDTLSQLRKLYIENSTTQVSNHKFHSLKDSLYVQINIYIFKVQRNVQLFIFYTSRKEKFIICYSRLQFYPMYPIL